VGWNETAVSSKLCIIYPVIQAPMAGGITSPELVAAVSGFGAMGSVGAGYLTAEQLKEQVVKIKGLTRKPFSVNLFVPEKEVYASEAEIKRMTDRFKQWGLPAEDLFYSDEENRHNYEQQLEVILQQEVPVCSFTFGLPSKEAAAELKKAGRTVIGTATSVDEALLFEELGADLIVMQGNEAGGHRGTFHSSPDAGIGTMALIPQAADALRVPVIAAGGIADGRGMAAAFMLGAEGVQMGSAFIPCIESGASEAYKDKIVSSTENQTVLTKAFSGKYARGISNDFIRKMEPYESDVLPYPLQNKLTKRLRSEAAEAGNTENMSVWAGQGLRMIHEKVPADVFLNQLISQTEIRMKEASRYGPR
jgi:nitronate monooxygenase